jgi:hypothetical protein
MKGDGLTKVKKQVLREMAEKCAGVAPGEKSGRWTHKGRVAVVYAVLCALTRLGKRQKVKKVV